MIQAILDPFIDAHVEAFERTLAENPRVEIGEFLPATDHPKYQELLTELIRVHLDWSWSRGDGCRLEDLRKAYPHAFDHSDSRQELAFEEFRQRRQAGEDVSPDDYAHRFDVDTTDWTRCLGYDQATAFADQSTFADLPPTFDRLPTPLAGFSPGDTWNGFRIVKVLGHGSIGSSYLASQDSLSGRQVVLKFSQLDTLEAEKLAQLQHTNVTPIHSIHGGAENAVICMPFFGERTLAELISELHNSDHNGPPPTNVHSVLERSGGIEGGELARYYATHDYVEGCLEIVARLADGLQHCHERGIVHGDVKPANVVVRDDGEPLLIDFNLASDPSSRRHLVGGTLPNMAPEQLAAVRDGTAKGSFGPAADIYALGTVLFQLLTGEVLFEPQVTGEPLARAIQSAIRQRETLSERMQLASVRVTPAVVAVLERCLAWRPEDRYHSAADLSDDIRHHLRAEPLRHAENRSIVESAQKFVRRNRRLFGWPALLVVLAAVSVLFSVAWTVRENQMAFTRAQSALIGLESDLAQLRPSLTSVGLRGLDLNDVLDRTESLAESAAARNSAADNLPAEMRTRWHHASMSLAFLLAKAKAVAANNESEPAARAALFDEALHWNQRALAWGPNEERLVAFQERCILAARDGRDQPDEAALVGPEKSDEDQRHAAVDEDCGYLTHLLNGIELADEHDHEGAAIEFRKAIQLVPSEPSSWLRLANSQMRSGKYDDALANFNVCVNMLPRSEFVYFQRGLCRMLHQQFPAAIADFSQAIELKPSLTDAFLNRATALIQDGKPLVGLTDLDHVASTTPGDPAVLLIRSRVLSMLGRTAEAQRDIEAARRLTPTDEQGWIELGLAEMRSSPDAAVGHFRKAVELNPYSSQAFHNIAHLLAAQLDDTDGAINALDAALDINPSDTMARAGRGVLLARQQRADEAIEDAKRLLEQPLDGITRYQVACIFANLARERPEHVDRSINLFAASVVEDPTVLDLALDDPDFELIVEHDRFKAVLPAFRQILPLIKSSQTGRP